MLKLLVLGRSVVVVVTEAAESDWPRVMWLEAANVARPMRAQTRIDQSVVSRTRLAMFGS